MLLVDEVHTVCASQNMEKLEILKRERSCKCLDIKESLLYVTVILITTWWKFPGRWQWLRNPTQDSSVNGGAKETAATASTASNDHKARQQYPGKCGLGVVAPLQAT